MFSFDLPKLAALKVELPTGGTAVMFHVGGGRFISNLPPLVLAGVSDIEGVEVTGLPLGWDSGALPADPKSAFFAFDSSSGAQAVIAAAEAGDQFARDVLVKMNDAEQMLRARERLGLVPVAAEPGVAQ